MYVWDLARHLQSPKPQNPEKKVSKVSQKEFGTPQPRTPEKFRQKVRKVRKNQLFLSFRGTFWGSGVWGSQTPLGRLFETFRGFGILGSVDGGRDPKCM